MSKERIEEYKQEFGVYTFVVPADGRRIDISDFVYNGIDRLTHEQAVGRAKLFGSTNDRLPALAESLLDRIDDKKTTDAFGWRRRVIEWILRAERTHAYVAYDMANAEIKSAITTQTDAGNQWLERLIEYGKLDESVRKANHSKTRSEIDSSKYQQAKELEAQGYTRKAIAKRLGYSNGSAVTKLIKRCERQMGELS